MRFVLGVAVIILFATQVYGKLAPVSLQQVITKINALPVPAPVGKSTATWFGLAAGVALLISTFSWRRVATTMVLVGAALLIASPYLQAIASGRIAQLDQFRYNIAASAIMGFGLLISILGKLGGERF